MVRGALQRYGILKPNGRELFRGCVVVPLRDEHGRVVDAWGRKVQKYQRKGALMHLRQQYVSTCLFNVQALAVHKEVTLCSSPIEALTLLSRGIESVVSLLGISSFDECHLNQFRQFNTEKVTLALANTHQGKVARNTIVRALHDAKIEHDVIPLPKTDDLNDLHMKARFSGYVDELFSMMAPGALN
jgi:DNA primase